MKRFLPSLAVLLAAAVAAPFAVRAADPVQDIRVVLHTDKGDIEATIFASKVPLTAANFLNLAQQKFYDGLKFHRVIADFMIQGGDPAGTGGGGPGYTFEDEKGDTGKFDKPGIFAMANRGPNTSGSQFFITHQATPWLDDGANNGHYTIFGQVTKGQDVVNKITQGDRIRAVDILDSTQGLFAAQAKHLDQWNAGLAKDKK